MTFAARVGRGDHLVRSAHQGHVRRHRPAATAGLGRDAPVPGRTPGGPAAVDEIVTGDVPLQGSRLADAAGMRHKPA